MRRLHRGDLEKTAVVGRVDKAAAAGRVDKAAAASRVDEARQAAPAAHGQGAEPVTHASSANNAAGGRGPVTDSQRHKVYTLVDALLGQRITEADARRLDELVCRFPRRALSRFHHRLGHAAQNWAPRRLMARPERAWRVV